ncbi:MAG: 6-bladed beta-propeller [Bacteroidota bacterium]
MEIKFILTFVIFYIFFSCSNKDHILEETKDLYISSKLTPPIETFDVAFEFNQLIAISIPDSLGLVEISKIEPFKNFYIIFDERKEFVLLIDENGNFVRRFGNIGGGPGEYSDLEDYTIIGDEIFLMTRRSKSLLCYDILSGDFKRDIEIGVYADQIVSIADGEFLVYLNHSSDGVNNNLIRFDMDGNKLESYFPFDPEKQNSGIPFSGGLFKSNNKIFFIKPFDEFIFEFDERTQNFFPKYRTDLLSKYILENKGDFSILTSPEVLIKSYGGESWNGAVYFENNKKIILSFYDNSTIKSGIINKNSENLVVYAMASNNPMFRLIDMAKYLKNEIVYFPIYGEKLFDDSFYNSTISSKFQEDFINARSRLKENASYYLLKAKLK